MEKIRTDNNSKESGIALVITLIITLVVLMLISGLTYLFTRGFQTNIINRQFSSVYEAANGGVEYSTGVIYSYLAGTAPANIGGISPDTATLSGIITSCTAGAATITTKTADGNYTIISTIRCLGTKPIPGYGGALRFPPPPGMSGGGIGGPNKYLFYSIVADASEINSAVLGKTEAIYRVIQ